MFLPLPFSSYSDTVPEIRQGKCCAAHKARGVILRSAEALPGIMLCVNCPTRMLSRKLLTAAALLLPVACTAQDDPFNEGPLVKASLVADQNAVVPGQPFTVAVKLEHAPEWHTYWVNPGGTGLPTTIKWTL